MCRHTSRANCRSRGEGVTPQDRRCEQQGEREREYHYCLFKNKRVHRRAHRTRQQGRRCTMG
jgi:hypothetical protein